jgi:hypothetical protein
VARSAWCGSSAPPSVDKGRRSRRLEAWRRAANSVSVASPACIA